MAADIKKSHDTKHANGTSSEFLPDYEASTEEKYIRNSPIGRESVDESFFQKTPENYFSNKSVSIYLNQRNVFFCIFLCFIRKYC